MFKSEKYKRLQSKTKKPRNQNFEAVLINRQMVTHYQLLIYYQDMDIYNL